jgi:hypothetical protein
LTTIELTSGEGAGREFLLDVPAPEAHGWGAALAAEWLAGDYTVNGEEVTIATVEEDNGGHTPGVAPEDCEVCGPLLADSEDGDAE